ncbi:MAG: alpha-L-fucosidase [Prevotella sp.]|nr:alpha-L-fucosidase [Prevotella sp.]MCM1075297.1 alpha-L-fucosidase [Ruminococcus sp.]
MKLKQFLPAIVLLSPLTTRAEMPPYTPSPEIIEAQTAFRDKGFGIFIHWGIYSMLGAGEWVLNNPNIYHNEYKNLANGFYPSKFDAKQWVKAIKDSGAKYICITSRHHDGFSMFNSALTDYDIVDATPYGRDILKELADECQKQGIGLHFYYSQLDWGRSDYNPIGRTGHEPNRDTSGNLEEYNAFMRGQLTELLTNYGPIGCIWYDGMWDRDELPGGLEPELWDMPAQYELIHSLQPGCLIGSNHHMDPFPGEDIQIFERDKPGENYAGYSEQCISALPLETCQTMNNSWGYRIGDKDYKSSDELIKYLVTTAGRNANLLLNVGPRPDGTLPEEALQRLADIGDWMNTYAPTVQGVRGGAVPPHEWGVTTQKGNTMYVHVTEPGHKVVFLPYTKANLKKAKEYASGKKVKFTSTKEGILITLPERAADTPDQVLELTFDKQL